MRNRYIKIVVGLLFIAFTQSVNSQSFPDKIVNSFLNGNTTELAEFFNNSIELIILNEENVYSKSQAEQILKSFFKKNPPDSFVIIHEGGKEVSRYAIGKLKSSTGTFRVTIYLSKNSFIHQLRIESDDE